MKLSPYTAATYNCNAYGAGTYSNGATCSTGANTSGGLANTGVDFWIPLVLGAVLLIGGIFLLIRRMVRSAK
ncbi:MAG TPA: LPXTG cell wall anchor domain-containing protein [Candidatus Saccharimonadales bacterium]|nr:LPXTG cell wall anchor domain-containing protein [Candidatus Saccharimonadales bacterium]